MCLLGSHVPPMAKVHAAASSLIYALLLPLLNSQRVTHADCSQNRHVWPLETLHSCIEGARGCIPAAAAAAGSSRHTTAGCWKPRDSSLW